jgi:hypothetical protein
MASTRPEKPPMVNRQTMARANSMGVSKLIEPRHSVATQLNTLTPVGTAMSMVEYMKNICAPAGRPVVNMWCAQTRKERMAIEATAYTIDV